jgi:hypothetical protein
MGEVQSRRPEPGAKASPSRASADGHRTGERPAWRAPVVTRLGMERTLFNTGSPVDGGTSANVGHTPG